MMNSPREKSVLRMCTTFLVSAALISASLPPASAHAAASDWQRGVSIVPTYADDFTSDNFKQSVRNAQAMGANAVSLVIPYMQTDYQSTDIHNDANTPSDATLGAAIDFIHSLGMKAILKPHLEVSNGGWRALIEARDRNTWYANYGNLLNHLGDIGKAHGADEIVIGTELIGMASPYMNPDNTQRWVTMINALKGHYSGPLTYSANWGRGINQTNEFEQIGFWGSLDYIGISAYWDLSSDSSNSVSSLESAWQTIDQSQIGPLAQKYGKPVVFTEIGYKSIDGAHTRPWDAGMPGNYNAQEQVNDFDALIKYWSGVSYFKGMLIWNWASDPNYGGQGNTDYTPRNKPAETTIKDDFGAAAPPPPPPPAPAPSGSWSSSATGSGGNAGSDMPFTVTVSNSGTAQDVVSDIEIYNSSNSKVYQKFLEHQNISAGAPGQYSFTWNTTQTGAYTLKVGVFNNSWSTNYYWNDNLLSFSVVAAGSPPPPPPPPPTGTSTPPSGTSTPPGPLVTDVWWPTDGVSVTGLQPFKAMIENKSVTEYEMYWQVDGDALNRMANSPTDYPHKESLVDLSSWTWKGAGPYTVNFVSKDASGNVISQKSVNIYVR